MLAKLFSVLIIIFIFSSCSKNEAVYIPSEKKEPYKIYSEALEAFEKNDFFNASKKFAEAELNFENVDLAAKSSIMNSFSLYGINYFIKKYPNTDYSIDLKFKKNLIENQLAAKEIFVARYYISVQKWIPAINRLKIVVNKYDETIFIEEALHRLVEINYYLGLENEAKKYANILGYNYNSSKWYEESFKILNKEYILLNKTSKKNKKDNDSLINKILKKIK